MQLSADSHTVLQQVGRLVHPGANAAMLIVNESRQCLETELSFEELPFRGCLVEAADELGRLKEQLALAAEEVASVAYRKMTGDDGSPPRAQSILISGESGAGKTEACNVAETPSSRS